VAGEVCGGRSGMPQWEIFVHLRKRGARSDDEGVLCDCRRACVIDHKHRT
jgi:hypothetical protein